MGEANVVMTAAEIAAIAEEVAPHLMRDEPDPELPFNRFGTTAAEDRAMIRMALRALVAAGYAVVKKADDRPLSVESCAPSKDHCKHYYDWPLCEGQEEPSGDPGDGLGVQGVCCECGKEQAS